jgi:hypothetical protein
MCRLHNFLDLDSEYLSGVQSLELKTQRKSHLHKAASDRGTSHSQRWINLAMILTELRMHLE